MTGLRGGCLIEAVVHVVFFFQAEDGIRDKLVTGVQTCALPIFAARALPPGVPLIGFAGAPFTLASYAIEGGASRSFARTKGFMHGEPAAWHALLDRLAELVGRYLAAQAGAGARALQLFDSWVGCLSPADYREYVLPHSRRALELAGAAG